MGLWGVCTLAVTGAGGPNARAVAGDDPWRAGCVRPTEEQADGSHRGGGGAHEPRRDRPHA
eukprot:1221282-Pyramimonas_sp.AAC.1